MNSTAAKSDPKFRADVARVLVARGYDQALCERLIEQENAKIAGVLGAAASAAAAGYAAGAGAPGYGSGYGSSYDAYRPVATDYAWEWDQFYDEYYELVWRCRGVQTGQFAEDVRCQWKAKTDWKWPSKAAPR